MTKKRKKLTAEEMIAKIMVDDIDFLDPNAEEVDEMNVTGAIAGYQTPNAFAKDEDEDDTIKRALKQTGSGYEAAKSDHKNTFKMWEIQSLGEATYRQYKKDESMNAHQKVNTAVHQMNSKLHEIEKIVRQNIRLKNESGIHSDSYWKSTQKKINKIHERMTRLATQMRKLGE